MEYYLEQSLKNANRSTQVLFFYTPIWIDWTFHDYWKSGPPWVGHEPETPQAALRTLQSASDYIGRWYGDPNGTCYVLAQLKQKVLDDWDGLV